MRNYTLTDFISQGITIRYSLLYFQCLFLLPGVARNNQPLSFQLQIQAKQSVHIYAKSDIFMDSTPILHL